MEQVNEKQAFLEEILQVAKNCYIPSTSNWHGFVFRLSEFLREGKDPDEIFRAFSTGILPQLYPEPCKLIFMGPIDEVILELSQSNDLGVRESVMAVRLKCDPFYIG